MDDALRVTRLTPPAGPVSMVLDTDTANEIDDHFALAWALLSPQRLKLEAVYAAPFHNSLSTGPGDGMCKSLRQIERIVALAGRTADVPAVAGSERWMEGPASPVKSDAAADLVRRAMEDRPGPLYVASIAAPTNIASAILLESGIIERIVVVWLAGQPLEWPSASEFNLRQDLHASRVLLDSGVPLVLIPCSLVAEQLRTTLWELEARFKGRGPLGEHLYAAAADFYARHKIHSNVLWDLSAVAWLLEPKWVTTDLRHAPRLMDQVTWSADGQRHLMRVARHIGRDGIFDDLCARLEAHASGKGAS